MAEQEIIQVRIIKNMERKFIQIPIDTPLIKVLNDEKMDILRGKMDFNGVTLGVGDLYKTFVDFRPFNIPECTLIHITKCGDCAYADDPAPEREIRLFPVFITPASRRDLRTVTLVHGGMLTEVLDKIVNAIHDENPKLICRCLKKDREVIIQIKDPCDDDSKFAQIAAISDYISCIDDEVLRIKWALNWRS